MKGFVCGVCGFVSIDGAIPEKCPVCGAAKTAFKEKADALKTAADIAVQGESEKKHVPSITIEKKCALYPDGCVDVTVKIGEMPHPMLAEHHIRWIDLYADRKFVSRVHLTPVTMYASACWHLKITGGKIAAVETCNLHGTWFNEIAL